LFYEFLSAFIRVHPRPIESFGFCLWQIIICVYLCSSVSEQNFRFLQLRRNVLSVAEKNKEET